MTAIGEATEATKEELVAQAAAIRPILEKNAAEAERERRLPQANIDALRDAGLLRITIPRRFGGYEVPVSTKLAVSEAVAHNGCGSTAWVMTLINVCNWMASLLPEQGQVDIWGENPDAVVAGVLNPSSDVKKAGGGYVVSGKWPFASGSLHADWLLIGIMVPDEEGNFNDQALAFVPASEVSIEDTWFVAGMKGTGSNTIVATDVFVPEHRMYSVPRAIQNDYATPFKDELAYRQSFIPVLTLVLGAPQLGLGQAAFDFVLEKAQKRGISYTKFTRQVESTAFQIEIARAAAQIDTGKLHIARAAQDVEQAAAAARPLAYVTRARVRADTSYAIQNVLRAIDRLMSAHGASGFANVSPLQRIWRDANTAGRHAVVDLAVNQEVYGKALVGVAYEENITPLI
jgi:alkylation response protein AidB-like acyl-CoA dehydrogenase